ncbi:hypothetical protein D3C87_79160 [compost metagenome]
MLKRLFFCIKEYVKEIYVTKIKFNIFATEKKCPICESNLINVCEEHWSYLEGNYTRGRLYCKNNCYVREINLSTPPHAQCYTWEIFGKDFYVFDDERKDRQIKELYDAINYWKNGERYLIEMILEGKCEWKN